MGVYVYQKWHCGACALGRAVREIHPDVIDVTSLSTARGT